MSLDVRSDPDIIYSILMKYFSVAPSCLSLADFYSTLPKSGDSAIDYWIRVNKAADLADEGLHRQGRVMDNIGAEVARMFVKYCQMLCYLIFLSTSRSVNGLQKKFRGD